MGKHLLCYLHIPHDGVGQVGQILFAEEGQGEPPQLLRQPDAAGPGFQVSGEVGGIVLPKLREQDQQQRHNDAQAVEWIAPRPDAAAQKIACQQVEKPHREHQHQVGHCAGGNGPHKPFRSFFGEGKAFHQSFNHFAAPTFQLTEV